MKTHPLKHPKIPTELNVSVFTILGNPDYCTPIQHQEVDEKHLPGVEEIKTWPGVSIDPTPICTLPTGLKNLLSSSLILQDKMRTWEQSLRARKVLHNASHEAHELCPAENPAPTGCSELDDESKAFQYAKTATETRIEHNSRMILDHFKDTGSVGIGKGFIVYKITVKRQFDTGPGSALKRLLADAMTGFGYGNPFAGSGFPGASAHGNGFMDQILNSLTGDFDDDYDDDDGNGFGSHFDGAPDTTGSDPAPATTEPLNPDQATAESSEQTGPESTDTGLESLGIETVVEPASTEPTSTEPASTEPAQANPEGENPPAVDATPAPTTEETPAG